jgi:hypothetical protein
MYPNRPILRLNSLELSQRGQRLAGEEPYLIRSGPYCELVISQPEHVHAFYEHDAKRHPKPRNFNLGEPFGRSVAYTSPAQASDTNA